VRGRRKARNAAEAERIAGAEAAAMAAAAIQRTRAVADALATTLTTIIETVPLSDEQRERITELMRGGDANEG
jgi:hypothetical protein